MDFIDKKYRIRRIEKTLAFCFLYHFTHIFYSRTNGTQDIKRTFQLFGDDPDIMARAAEKALAAGN